MSEKVGADDFIEKTSEEGESPTAADLNALPRQELAPASYYIVAGGRLCRQKSTKDGPVVVPLCNFTAGVVEEHVLDDGAETSRAFVVEGLLESGVKLPPIRIPAARFNSMTWVTESWGLRAVVGAGQSNRDYLREAIQRLSPNARSRHVFTHTGWRQIDGKWIYLTSNGAVGREGCEVDLSPELERYRLPNTVEDLIGAMRTSLSLLKVAPYRVTVPLWAGTFRAPLATALPLDLSLWLEGQTGSLKSTLAALFLSHFGDFGRLQLPGAWSSTANQLERRAFLLKDTLFVVDDYSPAGADVREMETKAARLLRAQGNHAGRGRLRADLTERPAFPPRGLILATGEQHPPGQSILARIMLIELHHTDVNLTAVTEAQRTAARLPHAMRGYLEWLTPQLASLPGLLAETFEGTRARAAADGGHLRVPEALGHLWVGLHCALTFATEIGACCQTEADEYRGVAWEALVELGRAQGRLVETERPSRRFLEILSTILTQQRGVLLHRDDPGDNLRTGIELLGWQDEDALYLLPEAVSHAVGRYCRDSGDLFPIREDRLRRDLAKEGLSECDPDRHTSTVKVAGRTRRVLKLNRAKAEAVLGQEFPSPLVTADTGPSW